MVSKNGCHTTCLVTYFSRGIEGASKGMVMKLFSYYVRGEKNRLVFKGGVFPDIL